MIICLRFLFIILITLTSYSYTASSQGFAVVELFTSEACSSCPPADALLNRTGEDSKKSGQNIFLLAYHVDYWNKGGWKDPFSKFQFTIRQENYSRVLKEKEMYTPQMVVNGTTSFTGSKEELLNQNIKEGLSQQAQITLLAKEDSITNDTLYLSYNLSKTDPNFALQLAITENDLNSSVKQGENAGKNLHHDHVVRIFTSVDKPEKAGVAKIPLKGNKISDKFHLIAFIQHKQTMKIFSACQISVH